MTSLGRDRRSFLALSAAALSGSLAARVSQAQGPSLAHVSVAQLERNRVLDQAKAALLSPVSPVTATPAPHGSRNTFFSERDAEIRNRAIPETAPGTSPESKSEPAAPPATPTLFRAQARALRDLSATVACLAAAFRLTSEAPFAARAAEHLRASLLAPDTRLEPGFDLAGCAPGTTSATPAGVIDLVPLAELARAVVFLNDSPALSEAEWDALRAWFKSANDWLNNSRQPVIARDTHDHRASAWLLLAASFARLGRDDNALEALRKLFRAPTLRHQIRSDGVFPEEVATPNPYRNTLFNFDLLAGACQLLSSPFDPLWSYELIDGVGMRIVAAYLYPVIAHTEQWGFVADAAHFRELPGRRPALLFAGRAYDRPEYVELWQKLPPGPPPENIAASFPIRQPLLWTERAPHGF